MTDSNRSRISVIRESTFGVTPTSPQMQELPFNSSSLSAAPNTVASEEIVSDRQTTDLYLVGVEASGDIAAELKGVAFETLLEGALFNDWVKTAELENKTASGTITEIDTVAAGGDIVVTSGGADFAVDDIVRTSGFRNSENNQQFVVTAATSTNIDGASGMVNETNPPVGARVKKVGFRAASGDLSLSTGPAALESAGATDFTTITGLDAGNWIKLGGSATGNKFDTADDNGYYRISSVTATKITFDQTPANFSADTGTGKSIEVFIPDYLRNGVKNYSHTVEQSYLEIDEHQYFRGATVGSMELSLESQSIISTTFGFTCKEGEYLDNAVSGATRYSRQNRTAFNTSSNVGEIAEAGSAVTGPNYIMSASVSLNNNLRPRNAIGSLGAVSVGAGRCNVTGSLSTYFGNIDLLKKVINNTDTSLRFRLKDNGGAVMFVDLPRIKLSDGGTPIQGTDQDVMADLSYQAIKHETLGHTIQLMSFDSVE